MNATKYRLKGIQFQKRKRLLIKDKTFAEIFVNSTYEATKAMGLICAFVILFSTIIEFLNSMLKPTNINRIIISLLCLVSVQWFLV